MKKLTSLAFGLLIAGLLCLSQAPAQLTTTGAGKAPGGSPPPAFAGVFDVAACGTNCSYWGTRASSTADRGNKLMNVCNVADVACADLSSDATTGALVIGTIGGVTCGTTVGVNVCTIKTLYDRGNATVCNIYTTACDFAQATIALRPTLIPSCGGTGLPCIACNGAQYMTNGTTSTLNQPNSISFVGERTGNTSAYNTVFGSKGGSMQMAFDTSPNQFILFAGSLTSAVAANDNVVHAVQSLYQDVTSVLRVDATSATVSPGAGALDLDMTFCAANSSVANPATANVFEMPLWGQDLSANFAALYANQKAYWSGIP